MSSLSKFKLPFKILISGLILYVLVTKMDIDALKQSFYNMPSSAWIIATALVLLQFFLISIRWGMLANLGHKRLSIWDAIRITALSSIANLLFITSIGGIVVRIALAMQHGIRFSKAAIATLMDRLFTMLGLLILTGCLFGSLKTYISYDLYMATGLFLMGLILSGFLAIPLVFRDIYNNKLFLHKRLAPVMGFLRRLLTNPFLMIKIVFISLLAQTAYVLSSYFVIRASGVDVPFWTIMALLPMIAVVASMPLGYGGWGIREGAFVFGLGLIGVPIETAFLISVQIGFIGIFSTIIMGLPVLLGTNDERFKIKHTKQVKITA